MRKLVLATCFAVHLLLAPVSAEDVRPPLPWGAVSHLLISGEDADALARLYGVDTAQLRAANPQATWSEGEAVVVPRPGRPWPSHTVRSGETLWRIGKAYGIGVDQLRQANGLGNDNTLLPGNVLVLPRAVKPDWSLPEVAPASAAATPAGGEVYRSAAPRVALPSPTQPQGWVEVRLADNRRAWVQASDLVVGSWQPQQPERVIAVGRTFVGVPYKWGGVDPNGWDCSGFVQEVFRLGGHQVPRLADAQYEACRRVEMGELEPGDLVFFNTDGSGVSHVGIFTGEDKFLHASSSRGVVEDSLQDGYFSQRYYGAGRLPAWSEAPEVEAETAEAEPQD